MWRRAWTTGTSWPQGPGYPERFRLTDLDGNVVFVVLLNLTRIIKWSQPNTSRRRKRRKRRRCQTLRWHRNRNGGAGPLGARTNLSRSSRCLAGASAASGVSSGRLWLALGAARNEPGCAGGFARRTPVTTCSRCWWRAPSRNSWARL